MKFFSNSNDFSNKTPKNLGIWNGNLHNKLNVVLLKVAKFQNLVENVLMCGKYSLKKFANFLIIVLRHLRAEIVAIFGSKMVTIDKKLVDYANSPLSAVHNNTCTY